ncbi:hypothetical protein ES705_18947 [subsurface metagenome]
MVLVASQLCFYVLLRGLSKVQQFIVMFSKKRRKPTPIYVHHTIALDSHQCRNVINAPSYGFVALTDIARLLFV